jgi:hypothetical protein
MKYKYGIKIIEGKLSYLIKELESQVKNIKIIRNQIILTDKLPTNNFYKCFIKSTHKVETHQYTNPKDVVNKLKSKNKKWKLLNEPENEKEKIIEKELKKASFEKIEFGISDISENNEKLNNFGEWMILHDNSIITLTESSNPFHIKGVKLESISYLPSQAGLKLIEFFLINSKNVPKQGDFCIGTLNF